jgi:uncharacterized protein YeaO (DUF488 family)
MLSGHEQVEVRAVKEEDMKDYDAFLDKYYKRLVSGTVQPNHIFHCHESKPTTLCFRASDRRHGNDPEHGEMVVC